MEINYVKIKWATPLIISIKVSNTEADCNDVNKPRVGDDGGGTQCS